MAPLNLMKDHSPKFRTEGLTRETARVFLQCSNCEIDLREIKDDASVDVTRAYYCDKCDPGVTVLNPPNTRH